VFGLLLMILLAWALPPGALAADYCIEPAVDEEITQVECVPPQPEPRCDPPCAMPPCSGFPHVVRPAKRFRWRAEPGVTTYRLTIIHLASGFGAEHVLKEDDYKLVGGICASRDPLSAYLPALPGGFRRVSRGVEDPALGLSEGAGGRPQREEGPPLIGPYEWTVSAEVAGEFRELDSSRFVYHHNPNPFGTAAIEFWWRAGEESGTCGGEGTQVDLFIHLPIEYPFVRGSGADYAWGYVLIQASPDLLGPAPRLGEEYELERIPFPDDPGRENLKLWMRDRAVTPQTELAYQLVFDVSDPWSPIEWDLEGEFGIGQTVMPKTRDVWPEELVAAGYLDGGPFTAPMEKILERYRACFPYPDCAECPRSQMGEWCCSCWDGPSVEGSLCAAASEAGDPVPEDPRTWKGRNMLAWFRERHLADPSERWTIEEALRALDRLRSRWPAKHPDEERFYPWMKGGVYITNSVLQLFDPGEGMLVRDHWRYTDSEPMYQYRTGLGASNSSTHWGLALARALNFPARSVCMAHYHDDVELWIPYGPPAGERYTLEEGEWVRFLGENFVEDDWDSDPPDAAGGAIAPGLDGIFKTTLYVTWDSEDSIPFNWFRSGTEPLYETCSGRLVVRQWPRKLQGLTMGDGEVRLLAVWPATVDLSAGEGLSHIREMGPGETGRWYLLQHLVPLGRERHGFVWRDGGELEWVTMDDGERVTLRQRVIPGEQIILEEPGRYRLEAYVRAFDPYLLFEIADFEAVWSAPTPVPTATPTATPVPTASPSPTVTPIPLGLELILPAEMFHPGETFYLDAVLRNGGPEIPGVQAYIVLDVWGELFFWPSWSHYSEETGEGIDFVALDLPVGVFSARIIDAFAWPETGASGSDLWFYGAIVDPERGEIVGRLSSLRWGFSG
jgi:hypothetical protein